MDTQSLTFDLSASFDAPSPSHDRAGRRVFNIIDWTGGHRGQTFLTVDEAKEIRAFVPVSALASQAAEIVRLKEALKWYASPDTYARQFHPDPEDGRLSIGTTPIRVDSGARARAALNGGSDD